MNKEKIIAIKENFNALVENKIKDIENEEALSSIKTMPFYQLKNLFESISSQLFADEKTKHFVGEYTKIIKESKALTEMYCINEMVNKGFLPESIESSLYLSESITLFNKHNSQKTNESIKKLAQLVKNCARAVSLTAEEITKNSEGENKVLNESLNYVLTNKKSSVNLTDYLSNFANVSKHINENRKPTEEKITIEENVSLDNIITENMEEWEKNAISDITLTSLSGKDKSNLFETYKDECISLIKETLEDEDVEGRAHLETMKLQLEGKEFIEENYVDDILKLAELKETLK